MSVARGRQQPRKPRSRPVPAPRRTPLAVIPGEPLVHQPTDWARDQLAAGRAAGEIPDYGSPAWLALPDTDARKLAAALVYAEAYRLEELSLADRVRAEVAEMRYQYECEQVADEIEAGARAAMARDAVNAAACARLADAGAAQLMGRRPTMRQLAIRRGEPDAVARADRQAERMASVPSLEELMRRPAGRAAAGD